MLKTKMDCNTGACSARQGEGVDGDVGGAAIAILPKQGVSFSREDACWVPEATALIGNAITPDRLHL